MTDKTAWTVIERKLVWDKTARKWSQVERVIGSGLTLHEADALMAAQSIPHDFVSQPEIALTPDRPTTVNP